MVKIEIEEVHSIGNWKDQDDFVRDAEEEDLDFCKKNSDYSSISDYRYCSKGHSMA